MADEQQYMVTSDLEYKITSLNGVAETLFGKTCQDVIGTQLADLICAREFQTACHAIFLEVRNGGLEWQGEMLARRSNGDLFQSEVRISGVFDSKDEIVGLSVVGKDMTENEIESSSRTRYAKYLVGECNNTVSTAYIYENNLVRMERFLRKPADAFTHEDVRRFMRESDYHPSTKNGALVAIKSYHQFEALEGRCELNGIMTVKAMRQNREPKPCLTPHEARKLLDACRRPNEFRLIYLGLLAGLRISDSARITEDEWLPDRLRFEQKKGRKPLEVPMHPELAAVREHILSTSTSRGNLRHVARSMSYYTDIPFTSHALRRTFADMLLEEDVQEGVVMALMGHSPRTVLRAHYSAPKWHHKVAAMGKLNYPRIVTPSREDQEPDVASE